MARYPFSPYRPGAMVERSPYGDPFLSLHREMNRLFDDVLRGPPGTTGQSGGGAQTRALTPHIDVSETESEVRIVAELPGVTDKDVEVTLDGDILTVRGEKKFERNEDKENYHVIERSFGSFQRSLQLPFAIEPDRIRADFEHGVLTVTVPKGKEQERSRRIPVGGKAQAGSGGRREAGAGSGQSGAATQPAGGATQSGRTGGTGSQGQPDTMQGGGTGSTGAGKSGPA